MDNSNDKPAMGFGGEAKLDIIPGRWTIENPSSERPNFTVRYNGEAQGYFPTRAEAVDYIEQNKEG